ncbi:hypothetical protein BLNAU_22661 [Blattamonas nauphoetae]|uniref:Uncharacterized protein n=1 Tax=Blattamonas nauphoetae TaxID=2049346 RepID=A0ABQ9WSF4_9EUKA|nr:hypothetical protein BLNAU_22661 [Blattamonas nauphoetae]
MSLSHQASRLKWIKCGSAHFTSNSLLRPSDEQSPPPPPEQPRQRSSNTRSSSIHSSTPALRAPATQTQPLTHNPPLVRHQTALGVEGQLVACSRGIQNM